MEEKIEIRFFNEHHVRLKWDSKADEYLFAIADIISLMSENKNPTDYMSKIKNIEEQYDVDLSNVYCTLEIPDLESNDVSDYVGTLRIVKSAPVENKLNSF